VSRVHILVEGQTEETFTRDILAPHLYTRGVYLYITIIRTKRVKDGPDFKGGITSYERVRNDLERLLHDANAVAVTTMFDFYGLPTEFPGKASMPAGDCYSRVAHVEEEFRKDINHDKFIPYLVLHEFEGLMFSMPEVIAEMFPERNARRRLQAIRDTFNSPEEINDNPTTAPSKRLKQIFGSTYQKTLHGPLITGAIGLDVLRRECPNFNDWLARLEALA
jgi:hypothetical protein